MPDKANHTMDQDDESKRKLLLDLIKLIAHEIARQLQVGQDAAASKQNAFDQNSKMREAFVGDAVLRE